MQAQLLRIARCIAEFDRDPTSILIEYPVQLSIVKGCSTSVPNGLIPVAFKLRNHCLLGLGDSAPHPRHVHVSLELLCENPAELCPIYDIFGGMQDPSQLRYSLSNDTTIQVHFLAAGSEVEVAGFLKVTPPENRIYDSLVVRFSLKIGDLHKPEEMVVVQCEEHRLQMAQHFRKVPEKDPILF